MCEQSRRFNSVGVKCAEEEECYFKRAGSTYTAAAASCVNDDCICVVGDPYEDIASKTDSPNDPFNALMFQPHWPTWTAGLNQHIQNTLVGVATNGAWNLRRFWIVPI